MTPLMLTLAHQPSRADETSPSTAAGESRPAVPLPDYAAVAAGATERAQQDVTVLADADPEGRLTAITTWVADAERERTQCERTRDRVGLSLSFYGAVGDQHNGLLYRAMGFTRPTYLHEKRLAALGMDRGLDGVPFETVAQWARDCGVPEEVGVPFVGAAAQEAILMRLLNASVDAAYWKARARYLTATRNDIIRDVYDPESFKQEQIARITGLTTGRISQLLSERSRGVVQSVVDGVGTGIVTPSPPKIRAGRKVYIEDAAAAVAALTDADHAVLDEMLERFRSVVDPPATVAKVAAESGLPFRQVSDAFTLLTLRELSRDPHIRVQDLAARLNVLPVNAQNRMRRGLGPGHRACLPLPTP